MAQYNVILIGDGIPGVRAAVEAGLRKALDELGLHVGQVSFLSGRDVVGLSRSIPAVAAFIAPTTADEDIAAASQLDALGIPTIPVVSDLMKFSADCPPSLASYNGLEVRPDLENVPKLVSAMLEWLGLLRRQRRLFLSYRRDQSREAALQLYECLQAAGFDVFLDTHEIRPGDDFQAVLMHRLSDCEVIVLLDTPGFLERRWTVEELARANLLGIGILQVVWPGHTPPRKSPISVKNTLRDHDLLGPTGPLVEETAQRLVNIVEQIRSSAVAVRSAALAGEFKLQATRAGGKVSVRSDRSLQARWDDGRTIVALPAVGIPSADRYHEVFDNAEAQGFEPPVLIYDNVGILDRWLKHLSWLDDYLPIKSLKVSDIYRRVRTL